MRQTLAAARRIEVEGPIREEDEARHDGQARDGEHQRWVALIHLGPADEVQANGPEDYYTTENNFINNSYILHWMTKKKINFILPQ